jgi:streptomycin 6-kinase
MARYAEHRGLTWLRHQPGGSAWLDALDEIVAHCAAEWELTPGKPFEDSHVSLAVPVTTPDGEEAVLKVDFPDVETECADAALQVWDGDGAVRLFESDHERRSLLIERCRPGTPLTSSSADEALDVMTDVLPRLWRPVTAPFRTLAEECRRWATSVAHHARAGDSPLPAAHLDLALRLLSDLPATQGEQVLVHQDLHGGNVLRAERQPWLAIDPKPLTGEREFALSPVVRSFELGHSREALQHRLDRLTADLGVDRHRTVCWTFAHTVSWNVTGGRPEHLAAIEWLRDLL